MEKILGNLRTKYSRNRQDTIIRNFYTTELNKGKTYRAAYFDKYLFILLLFFILVLILMINSNSILLPIYIGLVFIFFTSRILSSIINKRNQKKMQTINEDLKSRRVIRELTQMNKEEFINYVKEILEEFYEVKLQFSEDGTDLVGIINNNKYGIKCMKSSLDDRILSKRVDEFENTINSNEFDEGILITNSYFQDGLKENTSLILIDFLGIKDILKKINKFPTDEDIRNYIIHRYDDRKIAVTKELKVITFGKILRLYLAFVGLYLISYFTKYSLYYRVMAIVSFIIATILFSIKFTEYYISKKDYTVNSQ